MTPEEQLLDGEITPQFLSREEEELFVEARLGVDAIKFLNSDLGRVLRGFAQQEVELCKEELLTVPTWRKRKIQKIQQRAAVANQFLDFIREALQRGHMAEETLKQLREY